MQPSGTLVDILTEFNNENTGKLRGATIRVLRSTDKGATWSGPFLVDRLNTISISDPETGAPIRTGEIIPDIAVNRTNGRLYAVWQDARFSGGQNDSIAFSQSLDGGLTWSTPIKVNQTPTGIPAGNQQAFTPSVEAADDGTIGVTYYDFRNNTAAPSTLPTDYFAVHCHPTTATACTSPLNWGSEDRLTNTPFDMLDAPFAGGYFTGDYEGLAATGDFLAFFSQPHGSDPSSAFFRRLGPSSGAVAPLAPRPRSRSRGFRRSPWRSPAGLRSRLDRSGWLIAPLPHEPACESADGQPGFRRERNVCRDADEDADRKPDPRADEDERPRPWW